MAIYFKVLSTHNFIWNDNLDRQEIHPYFFKKHDITVLSSDYTNFFSSMNLKLEKDKSAKWHCGRHTLICKKNSN